MCLLTEAIKVENKQLCNLEYHQARFDKARKELLGLEEKIYLAEVIKLPSDINSSVYKCKIVYSNQIHSIDFLLYDKRLPKTIKLAYDDKIDYSFKYENRDRLKNLVKVSGADEVVIVKNGMITDTSRSNIVVNKGNKYVTPTTFLLEGTMRKKMLDQNLIHEEVISVESFFTFENIFLINAMLDLENQHGFPIREIKS